ncbi:oxalate oxidoreductase subunit delta [Sporomusa sp. KB1]|jgi:2-oxoacid:acceptor oxidoreductase gamma subunit (pyruvate/2-ketoisovalerate family)|uniref:oxalate oxidoreductase subunit delta n=1 Tax=Sporomusa sp. KB1 TaxID=943346 RepID=UPI0011A7292B|nr:2-oxoacid:acceptor oxidoreductase family protein [Sporomusa sp. KB1]TWH47827.1 pyruvate ferredoxin oxidoreductase gamma subunit/oxalate oxidoreductase subunit delta [Sporomusa sp. KB1]
MTLAVAVDAKMKEVTVWTRGVTLAKEARDTATLLAKAGSLEGKYNQSFDNYVDLPDRINVPVKSYARLSPEPIETFYEYENYRPDIVVLAEETLVKGNDILKGCKDGCVVVINTKRDVNKLIKYLSPKENVSKVKAVAAIDADALGAGVFHTFDGTEGCIDDTKIGAGVGAAMAAAVAKASGIVKLESLIKLADNKKAVQQGWDAVQVVNL